VSQLDEKRSKLRATRGGRKGGFQVFGGRNSERVEPLLVQFTSTRGWLLGLIESSSFSLPSDSPMNAAATPCLAEQFRRL
jgi:hypothetical protein